MRQLVILLTALLTSSCISLREPDVYLCAIVNNEVAQCIPTNRNNPEFDINLADMLGFICASPDDYGSIKKHHDELHKRLKDKSN